ncbi:MAG: hypothetical protein QME25_06230 [Bacteroidota bacterium]|nr:hypothetical protein [Bacteroidota bacterium]
MYFGIIGAIGGCTIGIFAPGEGTMGTGANAGLIVGIVIGFIFGIYNILQELQ